MTALRCKRCNAVLVSKFRHDFQKCECSNGAFIDGGDDYLRYGAVDLDYVEILNDYEED